MLSSYYKLQNLTCNNVYSRVHGGGNLTIRNIGSVLLLEVDTYTAPSNAIVIEIPSYIINNRKVDRCRFPVMYGGGTSIGIDGSIQISVDADNKVSVYIPAMAAGRFANGITLLH